MLSPNARAFSIENILGLNESLDKDTDSSVPIVRNVCPQSAGSDGMQCIHPSRLTVNNANGSKKIVVELCHSDLWHSFHNLGTEMIITKTGRRMFPAVRIKIHGLDLMTRYNVYLDFVQQDNKKYRYVYHNSKWMVSGCGEAMIPNQTHRHPDCPMDGNFLSSQVVSFERIKLTNSDKGRHGQVSLVSMQKFVPRINIESLPTETTTDVEKYIVAFPQTSFIAVTAYQNQEITRLKIARNPFAKGFREAGKNRSSLEAMIESYGLNMDVPTTCTYNSTASVLTRKALKRVASFQNDGYDDHMERLRSVDLQSYTYTPRLELSRASPFLKSSNFEISSSPSLHFPCVIKMEVPDIYSSEVYKTGV